MDTKMISFPNNIRFRFCKENGDAQVILNTKDYQKMVKTFSKKAQISKDLAKDYLNQSFYKEIVSVYGKPSKITLILDDNTINIH
jgi:hypothetical protein